MSALSAQLAKSFLQTVNCRNSNLIRSSLSTANLARRWLSDSPSSTAGAAETATLTTENVPEAPSPKKIGRPPKPRPPVDENAPEKKPRRVPKPKPPVDENALKKQIGRPRKNSPEPPVDENAPQKKAGGPRNNTDAPPAEEPPPKLVVASAEGGEVSSMKKKIGRPRQSSAEVEDGEPKRSKSKRAKNAEPKPPRVPRPQKLQKWGPLDPTSSLELPPVDQWHHYFPYRRDWLHRNTVSHPETARRLAEVFVPEGSKEKIVIEVNPGTGQLSRALLALPKERIKKLIVIEDAETFKHTIKGLEQFDPRVVVIQKPGKQWTTYDDMEAHGILDDVKTIPWMQEHDQLQFIMQVPTDTHGEQLVSQLMRAVPDRQWLFKYGRIPMNFVLTTRMWERVSAPVGSAVRCKVSAIAEAVADYTENIPPGALLPHWNHFHPTRFGQPQNIQMTAATITPKVEQIIPSGDLDVWDYCLRKLFVLRATPLSGVIFTLGPGSTNLLPKLTNSDLPEQQRVDPTKTPRQLGLRDWGLIVKAFQEWPFRPTDLTIDSHVSGRTSARNR